MTMTREQWSKLAAVIVERASTALWMPEGASALEYLRKRGFTDETIRFAKLGFIPHYSTWHGLRIPSGISIPSFSGGLVTQIRIRIPKPAPGKPKYLSVSGGKLRDSLWGIDEIIPNRGVIVFEGEFNALTAWQHGFNAVATTSATNKISSVAHMMKLMTAPWIMSWFDDDPAGEMARANLLRCDYHISTPDDLNGLLMVDKAQGTDYARGWLLQSIKKVESDLLPNQCYLSQEVLEAHREEERRYWREWNAIQDAFEAASEPASIQPI